MIDPVALIQLALTAGSQWLANNPRTPYETFSDPAPQSTQSTAASGRATVGVSAIAATYDPVTQCVVTYTYSPEGEPILLSVTLPDPSVPEYDYCLAHMKGQTFNG